jgi:hypothetical protein
MAVDGCWCPVVSPPVWTRDWLTSPGSPLSISERTTDVQLTLSWALKSRGLPGALLDWLLPQALADALGASPYQQDWKSMLTVWPIVGRVDDYLVSLQSVERVLVTN